MLIRWCWNAEAVEFATEERSSGRICHGRTRNFTESKITHIFQSRMRERRLLPCAGVHNFLLHIFTSLKRKRRFLKEAKHFYREDAKTAKRQKGRSKKHFSHGRTRNFTEKIEAGTRKQDTSFRAGSVSDGCTHPILSK